MARTYRDIITGALRLIGVIGDSEQPSSYQAENALYALQEMLGAWNSDGMMIYTQESHSLNITLPKQVWTIGPGADINVPIRPSEISSAILRQNASTAMPVDLPMSVLSADEWSTIRSKSSGSNYPRFVYMSGDWPVANLYLWPFPQVADAQLILTFDQTLNSEVTLDTIETLPPAYRQAIRFNLAVLLGPEYGTEASMVVQQQAYKSKNIIGQNNQEIDRLAYDTNLSGVNSGIYWIGSDEIR